MARAWEHESHSCPLQKYTKPFEDVVPCNTRIINTSSVPLAMPTHFCVLEIVSRSYIFYTDYFLNLISGTNNQTKSKSLQTDRIVRGHISISKKYK